MSEHTISAQFRGLSGIVDLTLPSGSTIEDARQAAGVPDSLELRSNGERVEDQSIPVEDGATYTSTSPSVKHGA